jgi:hypothetical protein
MFQTTNQIQYGGFKIKMLIFAHIFVIFGATPTSDTAPRIPRGTRAGPAGPALASSKWPFPKRSMASSWNLGAGGEPNVKTFPPAHVKQPPISSMVKSGWNHTITGTIDIIDCVWGCSKNGLGDRSMVESPKYHIAGLIPWYSHEYISIETPNIFPLKYHVCYIHII